MHIAIVINTSWNIYNFRMGLIQSFLLKGWRVTAIAPEDAFSDKLIEAGCEYCPISMQNKGSNPIADIKLFFKLLYIYYNVSPDVILHFTIKPNIYGAFAAGVLKIPVINNVSGLGTVFIRNNIISRIAIILYKLAFKFPKTIFFQNNDDRDLFVSRDICEQDNTAVLPGSGINLHKFIAGEYIKPQPFIFMMVARLLYDKGIVEYVQAAKIVKKEFPDSVFRVVGFVDATAGLGVSQGDIQQWEQEGWIEYMGSTADVKPYINTAGCIVLPSYREGTPRTLLEALALGKPIVTTNVPGCKETVTEGVNGYLCESKNAVSLAEAMIKILVTSENQLKEMAKQGRLLAENKFDEKIVVKAYHSAILQTKDVIKSEK